jgi:ElaB/YqjD/DUF883 family membrane-anchored ribosome-binding protein
MTNDIHESPEAIKSDIERTRQNMTNKIDQLQARFSPDHIKAQAQETVREIVRESTQSLTTYFNENSRELGSTIAQAVKGNPIPAALIGLGVGWLLVESYGGSRGNNESYNPSRNQMRGHWPNDQWQAQNESRYGASNTSGLYSTRDMSPSYGAQYQGSDNQYSSAQSGSGSYDKSSQESGWLGEKVADVREQIGEKAEQLREGVQHVGEQVSEKVGEWTDRARSQSSSVGDQAAYYTDQRRGQFSHMGEQASDYLQQSGQQLQRTIEDNPLVFGGVALGIGALIGMALPATRRENAFMGEWRDEVIQSAQEVANEAVERVKGVAEEVRPQLEETANKMVSDLKQSGQSVLADVKESGRTVLEDVKQTGRTALEDAKQTSREALQEVKQTGTEAVNSTQQALRDTGEKAKQEANKLGDKVQSNSPR